ncbi:MAG: CDP-6-deoxy-delta-3,4-glucoseen reductase [Sulfobacillus benefaciens]|uniref:CDP-6-deoxy-delta-3,4-glucoseen reductase n=1 Tax=Sulfobacillus benefaciens TaxID=453960 RepID=A0A2T2X8K6_9FIRM|nr:MAG: CDP-6-deoxy-delta-3,4-glucoseen reductase [Sulfobacillus benefaciens]
MAYTVRLEPVGIEMEVDEGESVLKAAFRQGIMLMHGCKEGQCASCKSILLDGDIDLLQHSTFALPDYEQEQNYILLCRTIPYSDVSIELLNYDEEILKFAIPVKEYAATVTGIETLTHDMRLLRVHLTDPQGLRFFAGQYVDLSLPEFGVSRSYSMANTPSSSQDLEFIIKVYPGGAFSQALNERIKPGDPIKVTGPYGICCRRDNDSLVILAGGGSGMAPLLSIFYDLLENHIDRPVRFFYGARTPDDLFYVDRILEAGKTLRDFQFVPALSHLPDGQLWDGDRGFIHEVVNRHLERTQDAAADAYVCGPPPLIDAIVPILRMKGLDADRIYFDKFYQASPLLSPINQRSDQ